MKLTYLLWSGESHRVFPNDPRNLNNKLKILILPLLVIFRPDIAVRSGLVDKLESTMGWLANITFDQIGISFLAVFTIRQSVIMFLPNNIAGPGGWLIDTECSD